MDSDKRVIVCNVVAGTSSVAAGAHAYLEWTTGNPRHKFLIRSRGGRYIGAWKSVGQMRDFRVATVPPEHPMYDRLTDFGDHAPVVVERLAQESQASPLPRED